jgi:hypothetical protein
MTEALKWHIEFRLIVAGQVTRLGIIQNADLTRYDAVSFPSVVLDASRCVAVCGRPTDISASGKADDKIDSGSVQTASYKF